MRFKTSIAAAALLAAGATGAAAARGAAGARGAAAQQQVNASRTTTATGAVEVHAVDGRIRVVGGGGNQVQVTGTLGAPDERLEVENDEGTVVVRVVMPGERVRERVRIRGRDGKVS